MSEQPGKEGVAREEALARLHGLGVSPLDASFWTSPIGKNWAKLMPSNSSGARVIGLIAKPEPGQAIDTSSIEVFITTIGLDHANVCNALRESGLYPDLPKNEELRSGKPAPSESSRLIFFAGIAQPMGDFNEAEISGGTSGITARWDLDRGTAGFTVDQAKTLAVNAAKPAAASAGIDLQAGITSR